MAMIPLTVPDVVINDGCKYFDFGGRPWSALCSIWNSNRRPVDSGLLARRPQRSGDKISKHHMECFQVVMRGL